VRVPIVNDRARSRATRVSVFASLDGKARGAVPVGKARVKALRPKQRSTVRVRLRIGERVGAGPVRLLACVGRRCSRPALLQVFYDSALDRIDRAGLSSTQKLIYKLEAIAGDPRLPKRFRGPSPVPDDNTVFNDALSVLPGLPPAQRELVASFLIPPRYQGSFWTPRASRRSARAAAAAGDYGSEGCKFLQEAGGNALSRVESAHAVVWFASGNAQAGAKAHQVSGWIERDIWRKLTTAFREPLDDQASGCDPAGDRRLDVFVLPDVADGAEGMVLPLKAEGDACAAHPAVVQVGANSAQIDVAHEVMHAIQYAFPGYGCRTVRWLAEGMATWAQTFVYPDVRRHHRFRAAVTSPSLGLENTAFPYDAWPFWYWLAKKDGVPALKQVLEGLGGSTLQEVLDRVPAGGLDKAFRNYATWVYNTAPPIGRSGFPHKAFRQWDGLTATPFMLDPLKLTAPGRVSLRFDDLPHLAVDFRSLEISNRRIRRVEITNPLAGKPRAGVLAFIKLGNGRWDYRDISAVPKLELCRDQPAEDVRKIILAVTNSTPSGGDRGPVAFPVEGKTECAPLHATLSGQGSEMHSEQCNPPPPEPSVTTSTDIRFTWSFTLGLEAGVGNQESGTRVETRTVNGHQETSTSPGSGYFGIEPFVGRRPARPGERPTKWRIAASIGNGPPKRAAIPASALKKLPYTLSLSASESVPQNLVPDCTGTPIERQWTGTVTIRR
jgi:hypothetical protein